LFDFNSMERPMDARLADKVAIVTGSGQGIGKGIALRLASKGATVVVAEFNEETARSAVTEIEASGVRALAYQIDISDVPSIERMTSVVGSEFGHIDILVNNAGIVQTKPMMELTETDWDRVLNVNMRGTFFCIQAVARQMIKQLPEEIAEAGAPADLISMPGAKETPRQRPACSFGKIVSLSSISGRRGRPLQTHYAASKAAIISITQSTALALTPYNINANANANANAVAPGVVPTPMWEEIDKDRGALFGTGAGEAMAAFVDTVPLKRVSRAEDIAGAVAFLCSTDADYITGQTLNVDGGFEMD
jgi:meso-butanediol dehydrogenase/(S,S)-butanediol dehydrogenase/diacetyl reductase